eukprot:12405859-Karenia_brevis.AAC.1
MHAIYHDVNCFIKHAGQIQHMCTVRSGVLQGCPLASILFVLAMEPWCCMFNYTLNSKAIVELCADDIAIVFKNLRDMPVVHKLFELARRCAGLTLKTRKCVLVPLSAPLAPQTLENIRDFLQAQIPEWLSMRIASSAEYLGIWLGPDAQEHYWSSQL